MSLTKLQVRTAIRQAIDDPGAKRWSDANLDVLTSLVEDTMFEAILDNFEYFTSQTDVLVLAGGATALSGASKRLYRIQKVVLASTGAELQGKLYIETVGQDTYYILGNNIVTDPIKTGNLNTTYSYLPALYSGLADGTALPDYPDGHEAALIYLTASWAMTKGDAESMAQIARIADVSIEAMLMHIARRYPIATSNLAQKVKSAIIRNPMAVVQG